MASRQPVVRPAAARAEVRAGDGPAQDGIGVDGLLPEYAFELDYTDRRGRRWTGTFRAHVLRYREKIEVGLIRAKMLAGMNPGTLDRYTVDLTEMIAHLTVALDQAPPWAADLTDLYDPAVVNAIYGEVASYEARFLGSAAGPADSGDGAHRARADDVPVDGSA